MPQKFLALIRKKAADKSGRIVFPETFDERTLQAVVQIVKEKTAHPVLLGNPETLARDFKKLGLPAELSPYTVIDSKNDIKRKKRYSKALFELRRDKGMTMAEAKKLMEDHNYFGVMVVKIGEADGLISGANCPSSETLRPALQIISTKERFHKVSGFFFMVLKKQLLLFADCMVNIEPSSHELAEIAIDSAQTAKRFGIKPKIAMLSFSTNGSAKHPSVDRVREATKMINYWRPDLLCEGEMQVDAALVPEVCKRKFPESKIAGRANVLIFPDLDSANIAYKLVERLSHAQAIGPILQGLQKPINDLSRGCSVEDIVNLAAITSVEAQELEIIY